MDRSSRWVSKSTRSLWIEKVKRNRAVQECETCKSSCEREPRHRQGWLRRAQVGPGFCPVAATCLKCHIIQLILDQGDRERHTIRVLLDDQTWRLYICRQFLWVYRHQQSPWLVLSYLGVGESIRLGEQGTLSAIFCENTSTWLSLRLSCAW